MKCTLVKRHHLTTTHNNQCQELTSDNRAMHSTPRTYRQRPQKEVSKANLRKTPWGPQSLDNALNRGVDTKVSTLSAPVRPGKAFTWHIGAPTNPQGLHHLSQRRKDATEAHRDSHHP
jgi:hypothetical protein